MRVLFFVAALLVAAAGLSSAIPIEHMRFRSTATARMDFHYDHQENWPSLPTDHGEKNECGPTADRRQSPIDLVHANGFPSHDTATGIKIAAQFQKTAEGRFVHGHSIKFKPRGADFGTFTFDSSTFHVKQFHFHTKSENKLNGVQFDAECHMVCQTEDGSKTAVLAVLLTEGAAKGGNNHASKFFNHLPKEIPAEKKNGNTVAPEAEQVKQQAKHFDAVLTAFADKVAHFEGSLTTPPCTTGVTWFVATTPVHVAADFLNFLRFTPLMAGEPTPTGTGNDNARLTQDLNNRPIDYKHYFGE